MRTARHAPTATLLSLMLLVGFALPTVASAAANYRPDGRIRLQEFERNDFGPVTYSNPWTGNDIYNTTGHAQTVKVKEKGSAFAGWYRWVFGVSLQNDGSSDRFLVRATGTELVGWTVKYFHGTTNITAAVVNGSFATPTLGHGEKYLIEVRVKRNFDESSQLDTLVRLISSTSTQNPARSDAVKLIAKFVAGGG